jgi:signal transduction histidine kinase
VEDILEVARLDTATEQAELVDVPLGEFVSRRVPSASVADAETVRTDPRRLERVLVNLLQNADRHGQPPVVVSVTGRTIVVRDHGPGFAEDLLRDGPSRFRTADPNRSDGHGLGLTIAVAQARVLSAELTLANAADGGAEVTVALPSSP